jgi:hypothetical protein
MFKTPIPHSGFPECRQLDSTSISAIPFLDCLKNKGASPPFLQLFALSFSELSPKRSRCRLFQIRILARIRRRAATEKA